MEPWWSGLERALAAHRAPEPAAPPVRRASVAAVLRLAPTPRVLLMRRSVYDADPWSGQVSLPGGRRDPGDRDLLATAVRETREEVGIDLGREGRLLGRLAPVGATARGRALEMDVTPFVFAVDGEVAPRAGEEAAEVFWLPLDLAGARVLDGEHVFAREGVVLRMPCWRWEGRVVWGMTYRILRGLLEVGGAG